MQLNDTKIYLVLKLSLDLIIVINLMLGYFILNSYIYMLNCALIWECPTNLISFFNINFYFLHMLKYFVNGWFTKCKLFFSKNIYNIYDEAIWIQIIRKKMWLWLIATWMYSFKFLVISILLNHGFKLYNMVLTNFLAIQTKFNLTTMWIFIWQTFKVV